MTKLPIKRPMKGEMIEEFDFHRLTFPRWNSPKIDGFRCILAEYPLTSRLERFRNEVFHTALSGVLPFGCYLDGEVTVGRRRGPNVLSRTSSGLTSAMGNPDWRLWVFDRPGLLGGDRGWYDRYLAAADLIASLQNPRIRLLKHTLIRDLPEFMDYLEEKLELQYEGVMTRTADGPYKEGKSTINQGYLLKVKPFDTAEGRIKGWFEEQENTNEAKRENTGKLKRSSAKAGKVGKGTLGGFILEDCKTRKPVRVGGGFTDRQRQVLWRVAQRRPQLLINALVRYKKQRVGEKDHPRHPTFDDFVGFRPEWDFPD